MKEDTQKKRSPQDELEAGQEPREEGIDDWEDGYVGLDDDERKAVDDDEVLSNPG